MVMCHGRTLTQSERNCKRGEGITKENLRRCRGVLWETDTQRHIHKCAAWFDDQIGT